MTKEEYVKELEKQFKGEETLIPETPAAAPEAVEASTEPSKPETEAAPSTSAPTDEKPATAPEKVEDKVPEGFETEEVEETEEKDDGEPKKKYSNRHIKKLEWQNRTYSAKIADLEARLARMEKPEEKKPSSTEPPVKREGESDQSYVDRCIAWRLSQMSDAAAEAEAEKAAAAERQRAATAEYNEKVSKYVPKEYQGWLGKATTEHIGYIVELAGGKGSEVLRDILGAERAPVVLAECYRNPALVTALRKMNSVERQMSIWKLGENSTIFSQSAKTAEVAPKPEVAIVGKVGGGASPVTKPMNEMSDDELYAEYLKQGGRV